MDNPYKNHFKKVKNQKTDRKTSAPFKAKKPIPKAPMGTFLFLVVAISGLAWGYQNLDKVEGALTHLEVSFFGSALAQEQNATPQAANAEKSASETAATEAQKCPDPASIATEETSHFSQLADRKKQLDLRENELNSLEEELHKQRKEVEDRIAHLDKIRTEIGTVLKERVDIDEERVTKLVDLYSNMKPKQAAEIVNDLNENLAVEVLGRMKKKNAAEIMNLLEPKKAQVLSEKFTGYKRR